MEKHCQKAMDISDSGHAPHVGNPEHPGLSKGTGTETEMSQCLASIATALTVSPSCEMRADGRLGTAGLNFPPQQNLATALGVLTDGGVLVAAYRTNASIQEGPRSCWREIEGRQ